MKYRIRDCQFDYRYFADGSVYNNREEILEQLADYHDIDYEGVKDDGKDTPYEDIWEFLNTLKDDEARLNWVLEYGQWEIEEIENYEEIKRIINDFIGFIAKSDKDREQMRKDLDLYLEEGIPF